MRPQTAAFREVQRAWALLLAVDGVAYYRIAAEVGPVLPRWRRGGIGSPQAARQFMSEFVDYY